jgi:hypothetical protein
LWSPQEVIRGIRATEKPAAAIPKRYSDELLGKSTRDAAAADFEAALRLEASRSAAHRGSIDGVAASRRDGRGKVADG